MTVALPAFNLLYDFWTAGHTPNTSPPDVAAVPAQCYFNSRSFVDVTPGAASIWVPSIFVRIPLGIYLPVVGDICGQVIPPADYYKVRLIQYTHRGFPNEYISLLVEQCDGNGTTPRP